MSTTIYLKQRNIYGQDLYYPRNFVPQLEALTGQKTLQCRHIRALRKMGFKFETVTNKIEV